jgi:diadenosine tetraphosphate (Ap4A) HIT family hydrolase
MTKTLKEANAPWVNPVREDFHVSVFNDGYPVTDGHRLFVPNFDDLNTIKNAFSDALDEGMAMLSSGECDGFNIGMNWGEAAGQTVMYPHVHLIPRRTGDMEDPRGGVRHVIPEKGNYRAGK